MALSAIPRLICFQKQLIAPAQCTIQKFNYAAIRKRKGPAIDLPVETDPEKLVNYCCGLNFHTEGEEVKLKPDSEYPEWLWKLRLEPIPISELDPNTKRYWRAMRRQWLRQNNRKAAIQKKRK